MSLIAVVTYPCNALNAVFHCASVAVVLVDKNASPLGGCQIFCVNGVRLLLRHFLLLLEIDYQKFLSLGRVDPIGWTVFNWV